MADATRTITKLYLLDSYVENITGSKLPSNRQALGYFLFLHRQNKHPTKQAAALTIEKIFAFWNKANIPVRPKQHCVKKLETLFHKWQGLHKHAARKTSFQEMHEKAFTDCLEDLFDIAHADALNMITIDEDKQFLMAQREKGRRGCMYKIDGVLLKKNKMVKERFEKQRKRRLTEEKAAEEAKWMAVLEDSSTNDDSATDPEDAAGPSSSSPLPQKRGRKEIISADLAVTLDRTNVSDRAAMFIISSTAKSLGNNIQDLALNRSTIRRSRQQHRKQLAAEILQNFSPTASLTVHWDGKLLPDLNGKKVSIALLY